MKFWRFINITSLFLSATILGLIFMTIGCSKEDVLETDAELIPYFDMFAEEAALRGITVDYEAANIEGLMQQVAQPNVLGQCFRNEEKPRKVIVDIGYWNNATELDKQFLIFHELGHCFLDRSHDDSVDTDTKRCTSIMHSTPQACPFVFNDNTRADYLDELFGI